jgi:hypothetical protein
MIVSLPGKKELAPFEQRAGLPASIVSRLVASSLSANSTDGPAPREKLQQHRPHNKMPSHAVTHFGRIFPEFVPAQ